MDPKTDSVHPDALPDDVTNEMLQQCRRLGDPQLSQVFLFNPTTVIKRVHPASAAMAEAAAMRLARERTSVPVPRVLKTVMPGDGDGDGAQYGLIFMEYIEGSSLEDAWPSYTGEEKARTLAQLKDHLQDLRRVEGGPIGPVDGSACNDQLFANAVGDYGPYADERAFRAGMAEALRSCGANSFTQAVVNMVDAMPTSPRAVLTHGDLVPRNILVRGGNVVGLVDWEMSGFYPEYWEYTKAHFFADYDQPWMEDRAVDEILTPYPLQLAALLHTRGIFMY